MNFFKQIKNKILKKKKIIHIPYIIEIVAKLTLEPVVIEGQKFIPRELVISDTFFRNWACGMCAKCCKINTTLLLADKIDIPNFYENFIPTEISVNNKKKIVYIYNKGGGGCKYLTDQNYCSIETVRPLQCRVHPIHIDKIREKIYLRKRQYGRNYKFGCLIKFGEYNKIQQMKDILFFKDLNKLAEKLGIKTHIPSIIKHLEGKSYE